jgi:hypothetical protein
VIDVDKGLKPLPQLLVLGTGRKILSKHPPSIDVGKGLKPLPQLLVLGTGRKILSKHPPSVELKKAPKRKAILRSYIGSSRQG